jgi:dynein light chain LC8-type
MPGGADKDGEEKRPAGKVVVVHTDMDTDLQDVVKTQALNAMKNFEKGELPYFMDVAKALKEQLDKHTPGTCWHVVVGKQFGSFVTNERKKCVSSFLFRFFSSFLFVVSFRFFSFLFVSFRFCFAVATFGDIY